MTPYKQEYLQPEFTPFMKEPHPPKENPLALDQTVYIMGNRPVPNHRCRIVTSLVMAMICMITLIVTVVYKDEMHSALDVYEHGH